MAVPNVAVVVPAYNEEALDGFLAEIEAALVQVVGTLQFVVIDDCSTRALPLDDLPAQRLPLGSSVRLLRNDVNLGHGPSAVRAWSEGVRSRADVVIHVDGDGQFTGADFPRLLVALDDHDGVIGTRMSRHEPWFRTALTLGSRVLVGAGIGGSDVNSPLRAYRASALTRLLASLPARTVVPHLHFAVHHRRLGLDIAEIDVAHRARRGNSEIGTTWQGGIFSTWLPSRRLTALALTAVWELLGWRRTATTMGVPLALIDDAA